MARPTLKKQIELPAGAAGVYAKARLRLVASTTADAFGYASLVDVGGTSTISADSTGLFSWANVRPNSGAAPDAITAPAGTVYEVLVTFADHRRTVEYVSVPDQSGTVWVQDILTTAPGSLPAPGSVTTAQLNAAIAVHNADTTAVHGIADTTLVGVARYLHNQSTPATSWVVTHNLGFRPVVAVYDTSLREIDVDVTHIDSNTLTVGLLIALAGYAECS